MLTLGGEDEGLSERETTATSHGLNAKEYVGGRQQGRRRRRVADETGAVFKASRTVPVRLQLLGYSTVTHDDTRDGGGVVCTDKNATRTRRVIGDSIQWLETIGWDTKVAHSRRLMSVSACIK